MIITHKCIIINITCNTTNRLGCTTQIFDKIKPEFWYLPLTFINYLMFGKTKWPKIIFINLWKISWKQSIELYISLDIKIYWSKIRCNVFNNRKYQQINNNYVETVKKHLYFVSD